MAGECSTTTGEIYTGTDLVPLLLRLQTQEWSGTEVERQAMDWLRYATDPATGDRYEVRFPDPYAAIIDCPEILPSFTRLGNRGWESVPLVTIQRLGAWGDLILYDRYALYPQVDQSRFAYANPGDVHVVSLNPRTGYGSYDELGERQKTWFCSTLDGLLA